MSTNTTTIIMGPGSLTTNQEDWLGVLFFAVLSLWKMGSVTTNKDPFHAAGADRRCCMFNEHLTYWLTFTSDCLVAAAYFLFWRNRVDISNYDTTMSLMVTTLFLGKFAQLYCSNFNLPQVQMTFQTLCTMTSIPVLVYFGLSVYTYPIALFAPVVVWNIVMTWYAFDYAIKAGRLGGGYARLVPVANRGASPGRKRGKSAERNGNGDNI